MDKIQRNALRKCRVQLVNDLILDDLLDSVEAHGIFTPIMLEYIKGKETRPDRVRIFLDNLLRRGPEAFDKFVVCLRESGHPSLASHVIQEYEIEKDREVSKGSGMRNGGTTTLTSPPNIYHTQESSRNQGLQETQGQVGSAMEIEADQNMEVNPSSSGVQESLPQQPPSGVAETGKPSMDVGGSTSQIQTSLMRTMSSQSVSLSQGYTGNLGEEYKMDTDPRGLLLIINNRDFEQDLGCRDGTDVDCEALRKLFLNLGFGVDVRHNLTAREMMANLCILARLEQLRTVDCLAVAILTHGTEDKLFGVDAQYVMTKDLMEPFSSQFCPALHNKPKFFIFNACRGDAEDKGTMSFKHSKQEIVDLNNFSDVSSLKPTASTPVKIPSMQDFLLAFSTIPGYVSWRHMNDGSWFIQELVKVFEEQAQRKHVVDMLVTVNRKVAEIVNSKGVQIPAPTVMLVKNWYLNPL